MIQANALQFCHTIGVSMSDDFDALQFCHTMVMSMSDDSDALHHVVSTLAEKRQQQAKLISIFC